MHLSPRFLALPIAALAVIVALSQAHSSRSFEATPTVHRAINCAAPTSSSAAACSLAHSEGTSVMR